MERYLLLDPAGVSLSTSALFYREWYTISESRYSMPNRKRDPIEVFLPLKLTVFHMLLALNEGECHGYALKREILRRTNGRLNLGFGTLYGTLDKLLEQGR